MALKALMLRKKLNDAKKALETLRAKDADFAKREAEIEQSIEETQTDEERSAVEEEITAFENEKNAHTEEKGNLERQIEQLESDLAAEEAAQDTEPEEERKDEKEMTREINTQTRDRLAEMVTRDDVKAFLATVRTAISEKRAIGNAGLLIPEVMLGLIRENIIDYSKLYKHVNVRQISGDGRQVIMGTIPEAVWTDCCADLNELTIGFNDVEVNCWKVGGYFAVCRHRPCP